MAADKVVQSPRNVRAELECRLERARQHGLVDCKAEIDANNHSTTHDLLIVLNNLLRIRESTPKPALTV